jgi:T-complex protein 1 subunit zeta
MNSNLSYINPGGMQARKMNALTINIGAARGLQEVLKSNLGPRGTMKMLVSGAGLVKITKDGNTLLGEMQIQHPTATLIARAATATDDTTGDGSTTTVILIGEIMRQCERYIAEGLHPRLLVEGLELGQQELQKFIKSGVASLSLSEGALRETLTSVARTAVSTKVGAHIRQRLADAVVDAVLAIRVPGVDGAADDVDLHMVEVMHMKHRVSTETAFINGIVMDHGGRSSDMPKRLENCYIMIGNVSLEYERSELGGALYYSDPQKKAAMAEAERKTVDTKVRQIIELKRQVCTKENGKNFVLINQKGIDLIALEMLAREGILGLRRAKRRNMERLVLACGGEAVNSTENLTPEVLGEAGLVYEHSLGDDKYTFVEQVKKGRSCTLLIKGANDHTIAQIKDAVRDGLRAVKNVLDDKSVIPGAGYFETLCNIHLQKFAHEQVTGKQKLGVVALAEALMVVPKTLAENGGHDVQAAIIALQEAVARAKPGEYSGLDIQTGDILDPVAAGILDNVCVKKSIFETAAVIASQLLLVDEIMKAGRRGAKAPYEQ